MIVTCPSCSSKYRVRDEAVPSEGAQLQCPTCQAVFVAHPPKHSEAELREAIERLTAARDDAEQRASQAEARAAQIEARTSQAEARANAGDARIRDLESQVQTLRAELTAARDDATKRLRGREEEIARLADETARMRERLRSLTEAEVRWGKLNDELAQLRTTAARTADLAAENARMKDELALAQKTTARLHQDVEAAQKVIAALQAEIAGLQSAAHAAAQMRPSPAATELEAEVRRLREQLATFASSAGGGVDGHRGPPVGHVQGLIAAVGPMLWGLEQAIKYLEPFSSNEPALAGHVRQLQLLCGVLTRLHRESASA